MRRTSFNMRGWLSVCIAGLLLALGLPSALAAHNGKQPTNNNDKENKNEKERRVSGWVSLLLLIAAALTILRLTGVRGAMLQMCAAALLFGAAGYAVQAHAGLAGAPKNAEAQRPPIPLTNLRHAFFGSFGPTEHWLVMSESLAAQGQTEEAAGVMQSAVREHPGDPTLWIGLGK